MIEAAAALAAVLGGVGLLRIVLGWLGYGSPRGADPAELRVLTSCALGPRKRVCLIEADGERLLVGVTEGGISLLRQIPRADAVVPAAGDVTAESARPPPSGPIRGNLHGIVWALMPVLTMLAASGAAHAANADGLVISIDSPDGAGGLSSAIEVLGLLTLVAVAPSILLMATCFTRIVVVLAFMRQAIGVQHLPPNQVLVGLALFLTLFVMTPVVDQVRVDAYEPYLAEEISAEEAGQKALVPLRAFMLKSTRETDLALFLEMSGQGPVASLDDVPTTTLLPAYVISELRTSFEIGFMVFLPFLVIDLVVSSMLISMGMIVLPPIVVSLPFKLMLFVLVDGWNLVLGSLVTGLG